MPSLSPLRVVIFGEDQFSKEFKKLNRQLKNTGAGLKTFGGNLTKFVTAPLLGAAVASTKFAMDFNKDMANVGALIPGQTEKLDGMKTSVQELAVDVGKSTKDIAGGMYDVVSAFGDTDEALGQLTVTARTAKAGVASTSEALDLLSAVGKGYGDTTAEALKTTADLAFMTVKLGKTTFGDLAGSMGKAVPLANALNVSQKELFSTYATLTGVTGNAAEVTTQLTSIMGAMLKPSAELSRTVDSMGFSSATAMMKSKGLMGTLEALNKVTGGSESAMAALLGRKEGMVAAFTLLGSQADIYKDKLGQMNNATGAMEEAFDAQTNGINKVGFAFEQAKIRITVSLQKMGDKLLPFVAKALDAMYPLFDVFDSLGPLLTGTGLAFAGFIVAAGPMIAMIGSMVTGLASISGAVAGAGGALALLSNPIGWVIAGVLGVTAVVVALWDKLGPLRTQLMATAGAVGEALAPALAELKIMGGRAWETIKILAVTFGPLLAVVLKVGAAVSKFAWKGLVIGLKVVNSIVGVVLGRFTRFLDVIGKITTGIRKLSGIETPAERAERAGGAGERFDVSLPPEQAPAFRMPDATAAGFGARLGAMNAAGGGAGVVTMDFKNMPVGVEVTKDKGRVKLTKDNGLVMEDA